MDYMNLFLIIPGLKGGTFHVRVVNLETDPCDLHTGVFTPKDPITYEYHSGRYLRDRLDSTYVALDLYSDRLIQLFAEKEFSGWRIYPVRVMDKRKREVSGYQGFSITGRCGEMDESRSERVMLPPRAEGGKWVWGVRGIYFKDDEWDGSDFFCPPHSRSTIVTERVKQALEEIEATNIRFVSLAEFAI
jgi:hypothetical protein